MWRRQWKNILVLFVTCLTVFCVFLLSDVPKYKPQLYIPTDFKAHKTMSSDQWIQFLQFKEQQYKERRIQLKHFCHSIKKTHPLRPLMMHPNPNAMIYDKKHKLAYCQIPKVWSSACPCPLSLPRYLIVLDEQAYNKILWWLSCFAPVVSSIFWKFIE